MGRFMSVIRYPLSRKTRLASPPGLFCSRSCLTSPSMSCGGVILPLYRIPPLRSNSDCKRQRRGARFQSDMCIHTRHSKETPRVRMEHPTDTLTEFFFWGAGPILRSLTSTHAPTRRIKGVCLAGDVSNVSEIRTTPPSTISAPVLVLVLYGFIYLCVSICSPNPSYSDSISGTTVLSHYPFSDLIFRVSGNRRTGLQEDERSPRAALLNSPMSAASLSRGSYLLTRSRIPSQKSTFILRHVSKTNATV